MRLRLLLIAAIIFGLGGLVQGQYRNTPPSGDPSEYLRGQSSIGLKAFRGLLDPSRMHMSHSLSFGYSSIGGRGATEGLYLNRIDYQISRPLWFTTHLGYRFQPSGPAEWNPANNGTDFVGGAELNWKPTSSTSLHLSFYRGMYPDSYYDYYGWRPYDYRPWFNRP
ncbi:hypothetical protein EHM69_04730 [candidate division KSB1 bacterium]|nr:MAG: hypothetical protein EHM69_04730 [candidate division KSB1 bacterium]